MSSTYTTHDTPAGPFTAVVDGDGAVLASGWTADVDTLLPLIHPTLRPASARQVDDLGAVSAAITGYHAGDLGAVDGVPVRQRSGAFLEHAWDVLRTVPAGAPVSYTEYAAKAGRPAALDAGRRVPAPRGGTSRRITASGEGRPRSRGTDRGTGGGSRRPAAGPHRR